MALASRGLADVTVLPGRESTGTEPSRGLAVPAILGIIGLSVALAVALFARRRRRAARLDPTIRR
jgi:hypothetical protein